MCDFTYCCHGINWILGYDQLIDFNGREETLTRKVTFEFEIVIFCFSFFTGFRARIQKFNVTVNGTVSMALVGVSVRCTYGVRKFVEHHKCSTN